MAELEQRFAAKLDAMQSALEAKYTAKLDDLEARHAAEMDGMKSRLDSVQAENAALQAKLDEVHNEVGEMHADVDSAKTATQVVGQHVLGEVRKLDARLTKDEELVADQAKTAQLANRSRWNDQRLPGGEGDTDEAKTKQDRAGFWSDTKLQLYTMVLGTGIVGAVDQFVPHASHGKDFVLMVGVNLVGLGIPVFREEWRKRRHGSRGHED
jgi:chromosome segregation ATPase